MGRRRSRDRTEAASSSYFRVAFRSFKFKMESIFLRAVVIVQFFRAANPIVGHDCPIMPAYCLAGAEDDALELNFRLWADGFEGKQRKQYGILVWMERGGWIGKVYLYYSDILARYFFFVIFLWLISIIVVMIVWLLATAVIRGYSKWYLPNFYINL